MARWIVAGLALAGCQRITNAHQEQEIADSGVVVVDGGYMLAGLITRPGVVEIVRYNQYPPTMRIVTVQRRCKPLV